MESACFQGNILINIQRAKHLCHYGPFNTHILLVKSIHELHGDQGLFSVNGSHMEVGVGVSHNNNLIL